MGKEAEYSYSDLYDKVQNGQVQDATIQGNELKGHLKTSPKDEFHTTLPRQLRRPAEGDVYPSHKVNFTVKPEQNNFLLPLLINVGPFVLIILVWFFMLRQMQSGGNKALSFGKSRARLLSMQQKKVTFKDVAGVDEAKEELKEIIEYLREPQKFQKLGGRIPKGVLLVGPPGTGKTLLARAVAGEANVPFFSISGSDFVEMFVGVGASRVRDLFEQGKKNAPCIIFIDEIDAVGRHRGAGLGGGHDEREQTLNQLLVEMDGFESNDGVILVAATNRPDVLDPALLRPGRFDRRVVVGLPDIRGREEVLKRAHQEGSRLGRHESERAGPRNARLQRRRSGQHGERGGAERGAHESQASDHVRLRARQGQGADGRRAQVDAAHRRGEARHGLSRGRPRIGVGRSANTPTRCTRSPSFRAAWRWASPCTLPDDRHNYTREYLETRLAMMYGGRVAEEIFLNQMSTGAGNDIERATELARAMVCEYGMSRLGPLTFGKKEEQIFLGREIAQHRDFSEETARQIDLEVRRLIDEAYQSAHNLLEANADAMHRIAAALLERETIDAEELRLLIEGKELPALRSNLAAPSDGDGSPQQVLKPESPRGSGSFPEGSPSPA